MTAERYRIKDSFINMYSYYTEQQSIITKWVWMKTCCLHFVLQAYCTNGFESFEDDRRPTAICSLLKEKKKSVRWRMATVKAGRAGLGRATEVLKRNWDDGLLQVIVTWDFCLIETSRITSSLHIAQMSRAWRFPALSPPQCHVLWADNKMTCVLLGRRASAKIHVW